MQWDNKLCWGDILLGGGNLMRSDFDHSENCKLLFSGEGNKTLVVVGGGESTAAGIFPGGDGNEQIFS